MYSVFAQIVHFAHYLSAVSAETAGQEQGVAQHLMESADACAGSSPHEAQELREAACAYLSVVR